MCKHGSQKVLDVLELVLCLPILFCPNNNVSWWPPKHDSWVPCAVAVLEFRIGSYKNNIKKKQWLVGGSTHLKNMSQIGSFPQVGVKINNIWNHHLEWMTTHTSRLFTLAAKPSCPQISKSICPPPTCNSSIHHQVTLVWFSLLQVSKTSLALEKLQVLHTKNGPSQN